MGENELRPYGYAPWPGRCTGERVRRLYGRRLAGVLAPGDMGEDELRPYGYAPWPGRCTGERVRRLYGRRLAGVLAPGGHGRRRASPLRIRALAQVLYGRTWCSPTHASGRGMISPASGPQPPTHLNRRSSVNSPFSHTYGRRGQGDEGQGDDLANEWPSTPDALEQTI